MTHLLLGIFFKLGIKLFFPFSLVSIKLKFSVRSPLSKGQRTEYFVAVIVYLRMFLIEILISLKFVRLQFSRYI